MKNAGKPDVTLIYPDVYELGACNFGLRVVRHLLLEDGGFSVRRAFHPAPDMYGLMKEKDLPWLDIEQGKPVSCSAVAGFGISSEILYTNVLSLIDLMKLPLRSADRGEEAPVILAGGGGLANPLPLMPFMDVFFLGEAEAGLTGVMRVLCGAGSRTERLERVSSIPGVLVPGFKGAGRTTWMRASALKKSEAPVKQVVPLAKVTHDRAVVELSRGCTRGCRFCQASQLSRPVRERPPEEALELIEESIAATGWEQAGFLTLSFSDYSCLGSLLKNLEPLEKKLHLRVSQPSLRPDTLPGLEQKRFFRGSLTMAPEAGTGRMRRIINKPLSDDEILEAAKTAAGMGARGIKLYFMVGLPGETDEDVLGIASLADEVASVMGRKRRVTAALSPFIPKPHTPFQWCSQPEPEEMWRRITLVRNACRRADVSWNDPRVSRVEYLLACGDISTGDILEKAYRSGAVFDGWSDLFKWDVWRELLPESFHSPVPGEPLPWDFVDLGVNREWLEEEYERALQGQVLQDCRITGCSGCGACQGTVPPIPPLTVSSAGQGERRKEPPAVQKIRVKYSRTGLAACTSHLDMVRMWTRTLRRTGLPLHYSSGFSRRVKLAFSHPIPLGMASRSEYLDFQLDEEVGCGEMRRLIGEALPRGLGLVALKELTGRYRAPDAMAVAAEYIIDGLEDSGSIADRLNNSELVFSCEDTGGNSLKMVTDPGRGASRPDRVLESIGARWNTITRTEIFMSDEDGHFVPLIRTSEGVSSNEG